MLYLSFTVAGNLFAVPVKYVEEAISATAITQVPQMPDHVLGVMNLRGKIIPVYDTRLRMGLKSIAEERRELKEMLKARESEHINWVKTLEKEINAGQNITIERNPTLCNFGKWYGPFLNKLILKQKQSGNVDNIFLAALKKFDTPHKEIHGLANKADQLIKAKNYEEAKSLISRSHYILEQLQDLFNQFYNLIDQQAQRDIILIVKKRGLDFGITIDAVNTTIKIEALQELEKENDVVEAIATINQSTIQILSLNSFFGKTHPMKVG